MLVYVCMQSQCTAVLMLYIGIYLHAVYCRAYALPRYIYMQCTAVLMLYVGIYLHAVYCRAFALH